MITRTKEKIDLSNIPEEDLLKVRICDLPIQIEGTWLDECIAQLYNELQEKGILFRPQCYLADEWLTPENETVIGIPFYLADASLMSLEQKMMLEVEGGTKEWCMKLLRHETGHAMCYAYRLNKRRKWQKIFGSSSVEYSDTCRFRPYSRNYVRHLDDYYAQYHPDEDFVETFAVWLTPHMDWRMKYKGWKALQKLTYVDELMAEIKGKEPPVKNARKLWRTSTLKITLNNHYKKKRQFWEEEFPDFYDMSLKKIFKERSDDTKDLPVAADILSQHKKDIINAVNLWTREKKYIIGDVVKKIIERCRFLKLVAETPESATILRVASYVTTLIMNYSYTGRFRGKLSSLRKQGSKK